MAILARDRGTEICEVGIGDHPAEIRCRDVVMKAVGGDLSRYRERHPDEKIPELKVMANVWEDHWSGQTPKCG